MSTLRPEVHNRAVALRHAFDRAFAEPLQLEPPALETLLAIRVGVEPCAMRLTEIAGLFVDRPVTRVPGGTTFLIGLAGFRGAIIPVYSLQALLGFNNAKTAASGSAPRWLLLAAAEPVAFAFEAFDGQRRVSPDDILPADPHASLRGWTKEFARAQDFSAPILHLPSLLDTVGRQGGKAVASDHIKKER